MRSQFRTGVSAILIACMPAAALAAVSEQTGRWVPGIGDPSLFGWLTVAAYLFAAAMAATNVPRAHKCGRYELTFWVLLSVGLLFLAVNKQLDLQSWFSQTARDMALRQGWYESRRTVQLAFIVALAIASLVFLGAIRAVLATKWRAYSLTGIGLAGLAVFVLIRAATFHHIDSLLGVSLAGLSVNFMFEVGSIAVIVLGILKWKSLNIGRL